MVINPKRGKGTTWWGMGRIIYPLLIVFSLFPLSPLCAQEATLKLSDLIVEALKNNPEIKVASARVQAAGHRIPQAKALSDPMFMIGYENEGTDRLYSFNGEVKGMPADSRWMFSFSQMLPFPGKLSLKGEMASRDRESLVAMEEYTRRSTVVRVKELYLDLFLSYATIDLLREKTILFARIEDLALSRYSTGMAPQQEVLMAQTEKYMLIEKEEMETQKIQSIAAMLAATLGRNGAQSLTGRPERLSFQSFPYTLEELIELARKNSPLVQAKEKMVKVAETKVEMAKKEFYPDLTLGASYFARGSEFPDMWNVTATINLPLYYKDKQKQALLEAEANLLEAKRELEATNLMITSSLKDYFSMGKAAERLMNLFQEGLISKAEQDLEAALSGYAVGKVEAITVISRLKSLIDYELQYLKQFVEREKAIARMEGIVGIKDYGGRAK